MAGHRSLLAAGLNQAARITLRVRHQHPDAEQDHGFAQTKAHSDSKIACIRYNEVSQPLLPMIQTLFGSVQQEPNLLDRLKAGIEKTRSGLVDRLEEAIAGRKEIDADLLEELEYALI